MYGTDVHAFGFVYRCVGVCWIFYLSSYRWLNGHFTIKSLKFTYSVRLYVGSYTSSVLLQGWVRCYF